VPFYLSSGEAKQQLAPGSSTTQAQLSKSDKALLAALPYAQKKGVGGQQTAGPSAGAAAAEAAARDPVSGPRAATATQVLPQAPEAQGKPEAAPRWGIKSAPAGAFVAEAVMQAELAMLRASAVSKGGRAGAGELPCWLPALNSA
jgi:hypothetical protein